MKVRHKTRGTLYTVLGTAELQAAIPAEEGFELVIYQGDDGKLWARPVSEFHDGRFEPAATLSEITEAANAALKS